MKTIIIDGNNLIHKIIHLKKLFQKDKEAAQLSLIETVKSRVSKNDKVIFVFDGHGKINKTNVIFSNNITADEVIRKKIENSKDHRKLKIISSDNAIAGLAKVCGCEILKSEIFWEQTCENNSSTDGKNINQNYIYDKEEKPSGMNKKEVDEYRKYFT